MKRRKSGQPWLVKISTLDIGNSIPLLGETVWVESTLDPTVLLEGLVVREARKILVHLDEAEPGENIVVTRDRLWVLENLVY